MLRLAIVGKEQASSSDDVLFTGPVSQIEITVTVTSAKELAERLDEFDACFVRSAGALDDLFLLATAGKNLVVQLTCTDAKGVEQLAQVCEASGVKLLLLCPRRFTAYASAISSARTAGHLGESGLVRIHRWEPTPEASGQAVLWAMLLDEIDLACWLFDDSPETVFAEAVSDEATDELVGVVVHLGFAKGGMAIIDCTFHKADAYYSAQLIGADGTAYADDHHNTNLVMKDETRGVVVPTDAEWLTSQLNFIGETLSGEAVGQIEGSLSEARRALTATHAAVLSAADSGRLAKRAGDSYELIHQ